MPFEAFYHVATSKKSLLSPQKKSKTLQGTHDVGSKSLNQLKSKVNEINNCAMLLQVVDKQTTVSDHANPVKAMGLVADPAVLSIMVSILAASVWIEIQKVSGSFVKNNI